MTKQEEPVDAFLSVAKAVSDENRVRILLALRGGELCVCQLIELLGLAPSTVSKHMAILRQAGLVKLRKDGRWAYYRLAGADAPPLIRRSLRWLFESAGSTSRCREDRKRLEKILETDRESLCREMSRRRKS